MTPDPDYIRVPKGCVIDSLILLVIFAGLVWAARYVIEELTYKPPVQEATFTK